MKYCLIMLVATVISISAMDKQPSLSAEEDKCYQWFVDMQKRVPSTIQQLTSEDREVFSKQTKFQENPGAVIRSRNNFAVAFYAQAQAACPEQRLPYDEALVKSTLVKMTQIMHTKSVQDPKTYTEACMWAWEKLSKEEQMTFSEDAYLKAPEETLKVTDKLTETICDKLIEIKLLTSQERAAKKKELYEERIARFEKQYKNQ